MQALSDRATRRWLIGGTLAILGSAGLALHFLGDDPAAAPAGQVRIAGGAPGPSSSLPLPLPSAASAEKMEPIPIRPTRRNGNKASQQASQLLVEKRDMAWAPRSEAALRDFTRAIPYIGGDKRVLKIACKANICEMNGYADPDPATGTMGPVWEALERDTGGPELRAQGLERTAAIFDTGRSGDEFIIYYRRLDSPPGP
ncbi:hypothetical protein P6144_06965 [Sphingomonas sp. HITSZ_GF]|uniref:hypothetical protein n=1 Tax=Sphingomonas sp. HITSZ_GF TaxID=3037247 RepID=UPI00240E5C75|nr:hypothetical protein [Sphingomonas sp. HITSZ_GF]MDG2533378.1 hypothetical protein [Sphingomonas sp. HITSZ_GF]